MIGVCVCVVVALQLQPGLEALDRARNFIPPHDYITMMFECSYAHPASSSRPLPLFCASLSLSLSPYVSLFLSILLAFIPFLALTLAR